MSHGSDKRLSSYAWQQYRLHILRRDRHQCQWRLEGCTDYATTVDHIIPREWDGPLMDDDNCVASCAHCNNKRVHIRPGEYGSYGTRPNAHSALTTPFFREGQGARGRLSDLSLQRHTARWTVKPTDYSRKPTKPDGKRRNPLIAETELG
jgi:hypothetical protein